MLKASPPKRFGWNVVSARKHGISSSRLTDRILEAVQSAIEATIGKRAQLVRTGGSIPILGVFKRLIGLPITAFAYGEGEGIHSPNEHLNIDSFFISLEAAARLYHNLGAVGV